MCAIVLARPALRSGPPPRAGGAKEETMAMSGKDEHTPRGREVLELLVRLGNT